MARRQQPASATVRDLENALHAAGDADKALGMARFFKTAAGQYGAGDRFLGVTVPAQRKLALRHVHLSLGDLDRLLSSPLHEMRFTALEILKAQYRKADAPTRQAIFDFYLAHAARVNNWDLVDTSAREIVGEHLVTRPRRVLDRLARSRLVWERRIAMVATHAFIRRSEIDDALRIAESLLDDAHDLMHKAVGWMLREAAVVDRARVLAFLETHYARVPRTALRYAIEHLTPAARKRILAGKFRAIRSSG